MSLNLVITVHRRSVSLLLKKERGLMLVTLDGMVTACRLEVNPKAIASIDSTESPSVTSASALSPGRR